LFITACFLLCRPFVTAFGLIQVEMFAATNQPMYVQTRLNTPSASKVKVRNTTAPTYLNATILQNVSRDNLSNSIRQPDTEVYDLPDSSFWTNPRVQLPPGLLEDICECGTDFMPGASFCTMCGQANHNLFTSTKEFMSTMYISEASTDQPSDFSETLSESSETVSTHSSTGLEIQLEPLLALDALALDFPPGLETQTEMTTLMVCDIPCRQNIEQLVAVMDAAGFSKTYDFVYMPGRKGRHQAQGGNVGYAFVNFKKAEWATAFMNGFQNIIFPDSSSPKRSYAKPARDQGFAANYAIHGKKNAVGSLLTFCDDSQYMQ